MSKSRWIITGIVFAGLLAFLLSRFFASDPTEEREFALYKSIRPGMSVAYVETRLGRAIREEPYSGSRKDVAAVRVYDTYVKKAPKGFFEFNTYVRVYYGRDMRVLKVFIDD